MRKIITYLLLPACFLLALSIAATAQTVKISALQALTTVDSGDWIPIVDISDLTSGVNGTTKKASVKKIVYGSSTGVSSCCISVARNGLTKVLDTLELGGALRRYTNINQDGNTISIQDNNYTITQGDSVIFGVVPGSIFRHTPSSGIDSGSLTISGIITLPGEHCESTAGYQTPSGLDRYVNTATHDEAWIGHRHLPLLGSARNGFIANENVNNIVMWNNTAEEIHTKFTYSPDNISFTTLAYIRKDGTLNIGYTPSYANNAAAISGGLVAGDVYYTNVGGEYYLKITH